MNTIFITGVSRGIGREFAVRYAKAGNTVIGVARNTAGLSELADLGVTLVAGDVTDGALASDLDRVLAGRTIDVCINNAGILPAQKPDELPSDDDLVDSFRTNVVGAKKIVETVLPHMSAHGKIVMLSSIIASIAETSSDYAIAYAVSKAALNMLGRKLRYRVGDRTVILIHPGWVKTDMGGAGAALEISDSVSSMIRTIGERDSFVFIDYRGRELPW
jgi:NAD(P)-dependent dehydrogenase (short-subunit alcohol dehydrogenase family)